MSQSTSRGVRCVGDYVVGRQIGSGSFSVVWHGKHRVTGADVAIKEIVTGRLNKKLHESLMSEIRILKHIENPNIIRLHDIIEETGRVHLILEYCKGGDLFMFIQQRQGKISEGTAKFFMQQLASGLQILRQNNLIHRDLKPQNLLLSTNRETAILKIADFGFARSLDPRNLAETLCGSPLYMAPEIMQLQKYDAKADLWSVGAILFQLVTGKPPFTGNNQIQLLQNIIKSTELQFPPDKNNLSSDCMDLCRKLLRRNPVERLTFEEFFNHPFLSQKQSDESFRNRRSPRRKDPVKKAEESSQLDCLPFSIDDDIRGVEGNSSFGRRPSMKSTYGFSVDNKADNKVSNTQDNMDIASTYSALKHKGENTSFGVDRLKPVEGKLKESFKSADQRPLSTLSKVADSLDLIDQDYVIVSGPPLDISSSSQTASKLIHLPCVVENTQQVNTNVKSMSSAPQPISGIPISRSLESHGSSVPSQGSSDLGDALEQPSTNCLTRIKSLKRFAAAIKELVNEKIEGGRQLEAFSIQLVILAIWKQALHICHTQAIEGSPTTLDMGSLRESNTNMHDCVGSSGSANTWDPQDMCSQIEKEFLAEVGNAEELAKVIDTGNTDMPDAMETIYQSALTLGKNGALDEYMGFPENSAANYTKAVRLFVFLLNEAPTLILNPPFSLTSSDRYRLRTYIDVLNNRQSHSRSQRMALLKCEDQQGPP